MFGGGVLVHEAFLAAVASGDEKTKKVDIRYGGGLDEWSQVSEIKICTYVAYR